MSDSQNTNHDLPNGLKLFITIGLPAVTSILLFIYFMNFSGSWGNQGDFGAFGDYIGGILNPILGFATVGLLVWSLRLQSKELAATRETLQATKEELAETKKETALSRKALESQVDHLNTESKLSTILKMLENEMRGYEQLLDRELADAYSFFRYIGIEMKVGEKIKFRDIVYKTGSRLEHNDQKFLAESYLVQLLSNESERHEDKLTVIELYKSLFLIQDLYFSYLNIQDNDEFAKLYGHKIQLLLMRLSEAVPIPEIKEAYERQVEFIALSYPQHL